MHTQKRSSRIPRNQINILRAWFYQPNKKKKRETRKSQRSPRVIDGSSLSTSTSTYIHTFNYPKKKEGRKYTKRRSSETLSNLIPQHDAETSFTIRLIAPLEEGRTLEWIITSLFLEKKNRSVSHKTPPKKKGNVLRKRNIPNTIFHQELLPPHHDHV